LKHATISIVLCLCLTTVIFQSVFEPIESEAEDSTRSSGRNMKGDEDSLPMNQTFLDLNNGVIRYYEGGAQPKQVLYKDFNKVMTMCDPPDTIDYLFDGTNQDCNLYSTSGIIFSFDFPINITMFRIYPLGNSGLKPNYINLFESMDDDVYKIGRKYTTSITQSSDYIEWNFDYFITSDFSLYINGESYINEIEIYYNPDLHPYWSNPSGNTTNYNNITYENTTNSNDFYNITYDNTTYENQTHINTTEQFVTYENNTEQSITYQNSTYVNLTNETTVTYENTSSLVYPIEYNNSTADLSELEKRLENLSNELDETKDAAENAEKNAKEKSTGLLNYINFVLLIILIIISLVLLMKKPPPAVPSESSSSKPEIEHVPTYGKLHYDEKSAIRSEAPVTPVTMKQQPVQPIQTQVPPVAPMSRQLGTGELQGWDVGERK